MPKGAPCGKSPVPTNITGFIGGGVCYTKLFSSASYDGKTMQYSSISSTNRVEWKDGKWIVHIPRYESLKKEYKNR